MTRKKGHKKHTYKKKQHPGRGIANVLGKAASIVQSATPTGPSAKTIRWLWTGGVNLAIPPSPNPYPTYLSFIHSIIQSYLHFFAKKNSCIFGQKFIRISQCVCSQK